MARDLSANALAEIATTQGTEPLAIIEVAWGEGNAYLSYADKDIPSVGIPGRVLSLSGLDDVVQVSGGSQSQQITVTLSDHDGAIKAIYDSVDIHKKIVRVYQWFQAMPLADKFLIFRGQINSPVEWDEGARTLTFSVISRIEDREVGFSIEEGDFVNPPEELIGRAWPLCFGTVINVPAIRAVSPTRGILATGTGIADFTLARRFEAAEKITCGETAIGFKCSQNASGGRCIIVYETDLGCLQSRCTEVERLRLMIAEQAAAESPTVRVFGGEKFPQGEELTLVIDGAEFTGTFEGDVFTIDSRKHPEDDGSGNKILDAAETIIESECGPKFEWITVAEKPYAMGGSGNEFDRIPCDELDRALEGDVQMGPAWVLNAGHNRSRRQWECYRGIDTSSFFWARAGSEVTIQGDEEILYVANILPSTILRVAAWREVNGGRQLLTVPSDYYEVRQTDYTGYQVMEIAFSRPLSTRDLDDGGGWEDDIYVTLTSTIGPNTVDILEWFIETYTEYGVDAASFAATGVKLENYPMHFPLLDRRNILQVLQEIAFQARCALWLKDDTFYIKYLAEEPTTTDTIVEADILPETLQVNLTTTEDVVTKYVARWRKDYANPKPNTLILRHNVKKYGTQEEEFDFYCFNIIDLVRKSATFWLIRKSNTWKRVKFSTPLTKLNLETFDTAELTLPDLGDGAIKCVVEAAVYDSAAHAIEFEVWTPVKSGTRTPYDFAWPATIAEFALFPTLEERELGLAGSGDGPSFSTIAPPGHLLGVDRSGLIQGFAIDCNNTKDSENDVQNPTSKCRADHGDANPSDEGDEKPEPDAAADDTGDVSGSTSPITDRDQCCKQALDLAQRALDAAQKAMEEAVRANEGGGGDDSNNEDEHNPEDNLPPCNGQDPCQVAVTSERIKASGPFAIALPGGGFGGGPGRIATSTVTGVDRYCFDSYQAAIDFRNNILDTWSQLFNEWQFMEETEYRSTVVSINPPSPAGGCDEPEEGSMTGYDLVSGAEPEG